MGFEVEAVAVPAPNLTFTSGIGFTDAEYTELAEGIPITLDTDFIKTPEWSFNISGEYSKPVADWGELSGWLDYAYNSRIEHDQLNSPFNSQDGYGIINARISFESSRGNWSIAVFGTNLTDERYIVAGTDLSNALGFADVQFGRPREWGVSLNYSF